MRRTTALLFLCILVVPAYAGAQQLQGLTSGENKDQVKGVQDTCIDEKITLADGKPKISNSKSAHYQTCVEKKCTRAMETSKPPQCKCGTVTFSNAAGDAVKDPISKCDPELQKKLAAAGGSGLKDLALQASAQDYLRDIQPGTAQGNERLTQALQNLGVPQSEAKSAVENDPNKAYELVQKIAGGDTEGAKQAATELKLNTDLSSKISTLEPKDLPGVLKGVVSDDQQRQLTSLTSSQTGFIDTRQTGLEPRIAESLSPLCARLGGCGNACAYSSSLTCRTNNPGALTWASWEAKYGGTPCGQVNNTTCFPSVEHGLAAKIDLLTGSRYFGGSNNTILSMICNGYSPNAAGNDCVAYANFVSRNTGIPPTQTVDPRNAEQIGAIAMAMARMENGRFVPYTTSQLQNALSMVYGGTIPSGTPGFTPSYITGTGNADIRFTSPMGTYTSSYYPISGAGIGSPFASVNPITYGAPQYPSYQSSYPPTQSYPQSSQQYPQPQQYPPIQMPPIQTPVTPPPSVATIIVQPRTVHRGEIVTISWSSVGMRTDIPCQVFAGTTFLAQGNEGTRAFDTKPVAASSLDFNLKCATAAGQISQQTASVTIQ